MNPSELRRETPAESHDVIIVGGRPSGATLAARLGQAGVKTLLVDRATFPSQPAVSSPIIYACAMALLDEIGAPEDRYAANTPRIRAVVTEARDFYRAIARIPEDRGRDYAYAIDRSRFDATLWRHAATQSNVTALDRFSVNDLIIENGTVRGIIGKPHGQPERPIYADLVIGADGRTSIVARRVGAPFHTVHEERSTSLYYAYWRNVVPHDLPGPMALTHGTMDGLGYLMMDSADNATAVVVEGLTEAIETFSHGPGGADRINAMYESLLRNAPRIWERLKSAERITTVRGLKDVPNYYRQVGGSGWALVGDAVHHKDPLGGQGIYDAIFSARAFAQNYLVSRRGDASWDQALAQYQADLERETLPYYRNTLNATRNFEPQGIAQRILGRYACENPEFVDNMIRVPTRLIAPTRVVDIPLMARTVVRGVRRDVRRILTGEPSPAAVPRIPISQSDRATVGNSRNSAQLGCLGWLIALPLILAFNAMFRFLTRKRN